MVKCHYADFLIFKNFIFLIFNYVYTGRCAHECSPQGGKKKGWISDLPRAGVKGDCEQSCADTENQILLCKISAYA